MPVGGRGRDAAHLFVGVAGVRIGERGERVCSVDTDIATLGKYLLDWYGGGDYGDPDKVVSDRMGERR